MITMTVVVVLVTMIAVGVDCGGVVSGDNDDDGGDSSS
jgi:hypothetical protein